MNKGNKILLGILTFVVACVVGYALFSEDIIISGSATASGEWDIDVTCSTGVSDAFLEGIGVTRNDAIEGGYQNDSCTVSGMNVSFNTDLLYPTAQRYFTVKVTNKGSIKATLDNSDGISVKEGQLCYDGQNVGGSTDGVINDSDDCKSMTSYAVNFVELGVVAIETKTGEVLGFDSDDVSKYFDENTGIITIDTNESIILLGITSWPKGTIDPSNDSIFARQSRTYEFVLNQKVD